MGKNQSKEEKKDDEIVIAQAGNVNVSESNNSGSSFAFTTKEIVEIVFIIAAIGVILYFVGLKCKKTLEKKIRREISRSQASLA